MFVSEKFYRYLSNNISFYYKFCLDMAKNCVLILLRYFVSVSLVLLRCQRFLWNYSVDLSGLLRNTFTEVFNCICTSKRKTLSRYINKIPVLPILKHTLNDFFQSNTERNFSVKVYKNSNTFTPNHTCAKFEQVHFTTETSCISGKQCKPGSDATAAASDLGLDCLLGHVCSNS